MKRGKLLSLSFAVIKGCFVLLGIMGFGISAQATVNISNPRISDGGVVTWDMVQFGSYYQDFDEQPIKWRILSVDEDGYALILADDVIDCKPYNDKETEETYNGEDTRTYYSCTWENSTLRKWLNDGSDKESFLNLAFNEEEQMAIKATAIVNNDNVYFNTEGGNYTTDKVFLLSIDDVINAEYGFETDYMAESKTREVKATDYALSNVGYVLDIDGGNWSSDSFHWWLRSPGNNSYRAAQVIGNGYGSDYGMEVNYDYFGVRPALYVNLQSVNVVNAGTVDSNGNTTEADETINNNYKSPLKTDDGATVWDCVYFGKYKQKMEKKPIEWRVLSVDGDDALLLAERALDYKEYNDTDCECTWGNCSLRKWLNDEENTMSFINRAFDENEQSAIIETEVVNDDDTMYGTEGGETTLDKLLLLSSSDISNNNYGFESEKFDASNYNASKTRATTATDYAGYRYEVLSSQRNYYPVKDNSWWLRSPGAHSGSAAKYVTNYGATDDMDVYSHTAIRPAMHINLLKASVLNSFKVLDAKTCLKEDSGTEGEQPTVEIYGDFEYQLTDDSKIMITGYKGSDTEIEIPSEIDGKLVTTIAYRAFAFCHTLTNIKLPDGLTTIGIQAFWDCDELTSIELPKDVTYIMDDAFQGCSKLVSIKIPKGTKDIGRWVFSGCYNLENIEVDSDNEVYKDGKANAIIEKETNMLIAGCKNTKIPEDVIIIGSDAFRGCIGLENIIIPDSVTSIWSGAFADCRNLKSIEIPANTTYIDSSIVSGCYNLEIINVDSRNEVFTDGNSNAVIQKESNKIIAGCINTQIPEGVSSVGYEAFYECHGLTNIEIPAGVIEIGDKAFNSCSDLTSIILPEGVTSIGSEAFEYCYGLIYAEIPSSVTNIEEDAFKDVGRDMVIITPADSYAEKWAGEKGIEVFNSIEAFDEQRNNVCVTFATKEGTIYGWGYSKAQTIKITKGESVKEAYSACDNEGYAFIGWKTVGDDTLYVISPTDNAGEEYIKNYIPTKDTIFYSQWADAYNITFKSDYGYINGDKKNNEVNYTVRQGKSISISECPNIYSYSQDEYSFVGWKEENGLDDKLYIVGNFMNEGEESLYNYVPTKDTTFIAVWEQNYKVTFVSDIGCINGYEELTTVEKYYRKGSVLSSGCPQAYRSGMVCNGWVTEGDTTLYVSNREPREGEKSINEYIMPEKDIVFVAVWGEAWNVTYLSEEGYINGFNDVLYREYQIRKTDSISENVPYVGYRTGYVFLGWKIEGDNSVLYVTDTNIKEGQKSIFDYIPNKNVTFIAQWTPEILIPIDQNNFPDGKFREYVISNFDLNDDGNLSIAEINAVTNIDVLSKKITSLKGIEYFDSLKTLVCSENNLDSIDLSGNVALEYLYCDSNNLTTLDVSKNVELKDLFCGDNPIGTLDVSKNTKLWRLYCYKNGLDSLDLTNNAELEILSCAGNNIRSLDLSNKLKLRLFYCTDNKLSHLDVTHNTALEDLYCSGNELEELDISKNTKLFGFACGNNKLTKLNVDNNAELEYLDCYCNNLTELNLDNNKNLVGLTCFSNELTTINLSNNTKLTDLLCWDNKFEKVNVANNKITYYYPEEGYSFYDDYEKWGGVVIYNKDDNVIIVNAKKTSTPDSQEETDEKNNEVKKEEISSKEQKGEQNGDSTQKDKEDLNSYSPKENEGLTEDSKNTEAFEVGTMFETKDAEYSVTKNEGNQIEISYQTPENTKATSYVVPDTVTLSDGTVAQVTAVAPNAFKKCKKLKKVVLGKNIEKVGKNAFNGCKNLKTITIKSTKLTKKSFGKNAFKGISKKATITVPKKQYKNYKKWLKAAGLPKGVKIKKK